MSGAKQPRMSPGTKETLDFLYEASGQKRPDVMSKIFIHATPKPDACKHDFQGWRTFDDGNGGEQVCTKCGIGAMSYSLSLGDLP